jgi:hypothetical protein
MEEIWKDIPNYEGFYQASNLGRIKSIDRVVNHAKSGKLRLVGKILKTPIASNGYAVVNLSRNRNTITKYVHAIIAETFLNHKPNGHHFVIDHIDEDKSNNELINLRITTSRYNTTRNQNGFTSKYVGVNYRKGVRKWRANIRIHGKLINLGNYNTEIEAHQSYQKKLSEITKNTFLNGDPSLPI